MKNPDKLRELLTNLRESADKRPLQTRDAGDCVESSRVVYDMDEALALLKGRERTLRELVAKWRERTHKFITDLSVVQINRCADELEAALNADHAIDMTDEALRFAQKDFTGQTQSKEE